MEQNTTETPIFVYCPSPSSEMEVLTSVALVCIICINIRKSLWMYKQNNYALTTYALFRQPFLFLLLLI